MDSRRDLLRKFAVGAAVAAVPASAAAGPSTAGTAPGVTAQAAPAALVDGEAPWWLLAPLRPGQHLGLGWALADFAPVERGASILTLVHRDLAPERGGLARVHLCLHDGKPHGVASSALLDLVLMDGGNGDRATEEDLGRVVIALAGVIRRNELDERGDLRSLARLQPHDERLARYGPETLK